MAAIITALNVADHVNRNFDIDETNWTDALIDRLQGELEIRLNRDLSVRTVVEKKVLQPDTNRVYLDSSPVVNILSVSIATTATPVGNLSDDLLDPSAYIYTEFGELTLTSYLELGWDWMAIGETLVDVTYTAGVNGIDYPGIKSVMLQAAARQFLARSRDIQGIKSYSVEGSSYSGMSTDMFTEDEMKMLNRFKRRVVAF